MASVATFPDVEDWLPAALTVGVPVASRVPNPRPPEFIRTFRTGGPGRFNRVSEVVTVVVESYATTETRAAALAQACRTALAETQGRTVLGVHVKTVTEASGIGNLPHPSIPGARYTQTFDFHLKGTVPASQTQETP